MARRLSTEEQAALNAAKPRKTRKLVSGVGLNDADYAIGVIFEGRQIFCPIYSTWSNMLIRCYRPDRLAKFPTYAGCSVADEWLTFSNFHSWMVEQDWEGKQLDKDILVSGNKVYSKETCAFIPPAINSLLTDHRTMRGQHPQGVHYCKRNRTFIAQIRFGGGKTRIGCFDTPEEAEQAYLKIKAEYIKQQAYSYQLSPDVIHALHTIADSLIRRIAV
jgi:hypothetical protein